MYISVERNPTIFLIHLSTRMDILLMSYVLHRIILSWYPAKDNTPDDFQERKQYGIAQKKQTWRNIPVRIARISPFQNSNWRWQQCSFMRRIHSSSRDTVSQSLQRTPCAR